MRSRRPLEFPASSGDKDVGWTKEGVSFTAANGDAECLYYQAVEELSSSIKAIADERPILLEGGVYPGCWLESTGSISAEILSRFLPEVARATFESFATYQRADGLLPYKITAEGPVFAQIQIVTPLARCVWNHFRLHGDRDFLQRMYNAMAANDRWLAANRDTRGTGSVEAFCTFDTGHDLSPRFATVPDRPFANDPARFDGAHPLLPYIAPDLTANVACQRRYLARIADTLGAEPAFWNAAADASEAALFSQCFDEEDGLFYDRARDGSFVRVQSDVLARVLACEVGDQAFFDGALRRYLLNTRKFYAEYPFTSIALDDPTFDGDFSINSWAGPTNFLSLIRAPHAFEHHGRFAELAAVQLKTLEALIRADRFPQTLSPWTGQAGFTEGYSPAILCYLDFIERSAGILPRPDGTLWFTGLDIPGAGGTAYVRDIDGRRYELTVADGEMVALCNGEPLFAAPSGLRMITDRKGRLLQAIGMSETPVAGDVQYSSALPVELGPNDVGHLIEDEFEVDRSLGFIRPST